MPGRAKLKKTLPKDLEALLARAQKSGDDRALKAALEACEPDARGGYGRKTLLMFGGCTASLARWQLARGASLAAVDEHGDTALHEAAFARFHHALSAEVLISLGADVHAVNHTGLTPLHCAVDGKNLASTRALLAHGARHDARSREGLTPLEYGLQRLSNIDLVDMVPVARLLLEHGASRTGKAPAFVKHAAENFEFHRAGFAPDAVEGTAAACAELCALFDVAVPAPRHLHDGTSPIAVPPGRWQAQHAALWELLVPSSGACATVQGEVVRIAGRVGDELHRNGGVNWDSAYTAMLQAFVQHVSSGAALPPGELSELAALAKRGARMSTEKGGDTARLAELSVKWVSQNPTPVALSRPRYRR